MAQRNDACNLLVKQCCQRFEIEKWLKRPEKTRTHTHTHTQKKKHKRLKYDFISHLLKISKQCKLLKHLHSQKQKLKVTQFEKVRFMKVNELKLTHVELFQFFHILCAAANASELLCVAYLESIERFLYHSNLSF